MEEWERALVQRLLTEWEHKHVALHWNEAANTWEANGTPVADMDAAIAREYAQGWKLCGTTQDTWGMVRLSTGEIVPPSPTRTFRLFFERRRH
ncbi:MAG TPA: hypothetical protein VF040_09350 [Ktedonobacterales bacterium]